MDQSDIATSPTTTATTATTAATAGGNEIMLFGVRVVVDSMRKSVSLNNLSQYQHLTDSNHYLSSPPSAAAAAAGYASADDAVNLSSSATAATRERKRGVPWTEEEHKLFLLGLQKVGKGDWRGISRNFVKTRTPTQVASHAQKYFLRRSNLNRRRRRSSLFDITTDTVVAIPASDQPIVEENGEKNNGGVSQSPVETATFSTAQIYPEIAVAKNRTGEFDLNSSTLTDPSSLSLNLSLSMTSYVGENSPASTSSRRSVFQGFNNGDNIISVA